LWATQKLLPLTPGGEFAAGLAKGRSAALELDRRLRGEPAFQALSRPPELDIVAWKVRADQPEIASALAQKIFDACARRDLHLALVELPLNWFEPEADGQLVTCLRSVLMKPEHEAWLARIWERLMAATAEVMGERSK
jgi:hypothetical protein